MNRTISISPVVLAFAGTCVLGASETSSARPNILPIVSDDSGPVYPARETRTISGWTVHVSRVLLATNAEATSLALKLLAIQLDDIVRVVPPAEVAEWRKVPLWVSPECPKTPPRAEYHPNARWLREDGRDPAMAKGVEFTNVRIFESETKRMPVFALHELAHAYHDRVRGNDHAGIKTAYEEAKTSGRYDQVERRDARGRVSIARAYAMNNPQEYFAETTEVFFGTNDFFPFTRDELRQHDPKMYQLLERAWDGETAPDSVESIEHCPLWGGGKADNDGAEPGTPAKRKEQVKP